MRIHQIALVFALKQSQRAEYLLCNDAFHVLEKAKDLSSLKRLTHIGNNAFGNLKEADFSSLTSLTHIGDAAFYSFRIADFSSLTSLTEIRWQAFYKLKETLVLLV